MYLEYLANELLIHIFFCCNTVQDALNLASTNYRLHRVFSGSKKLAIMFQAAETQYGPLEDAVQVATHNASQPAHIIRSVPHSFALLRQLLSFGRTAEKWESVYPVKKWKDDYENRRLLTREEAYRVRRAVYRLWLYSRAFHCARFPRTSRLQRHAVLERAELLHNWSGPELAEMEDVRGVLRDVVRSHICPSNGAVQRKFRKRFPDSDHQLLFNIHLNYPPPSLHTIAAAASSSPNSSFFTGTGTTAAAPTAVSANSAFHAQFHSAHAQHHQYHQQRSGAGAGASPFSRGNPDSAHGSPSVGMRYAATPWHEPGSEGWGDDILHYYVVEDMLKLDPGQIMWLRDNAPLKGMVQEYVRNLGEWFENNGETFGQTLEWVLKERNEDADEFKESIEDRASGIVVD